MSFDSHSHPVSLCRNHPWRVFETVKVVNKVGRLRSLCHSPGLPGSSPVSMRSSCTSTPRTSYYGSDNVSFTLEDRPSSSQAQKEDNRCVSISEYCVYDQQHACICTACMFLFGCRYFSETLKAVIFFYCDL